MHFEYETTWCRAVRQWDEPEDDHGHMVPFQTGNVPNDPRSDDRDVSAPARRLRKFSWMGTDRSCGLSENMDFRSYQSLSTRAGGEVLGEF